MLPPGLFPAADPARGTAAPSPRKCQAGMLFQGWWPACWIEVPHLMHGDILTEPRCLQMMHAGHARHRGTASLVYCHLRSP